MLSFRLLRNATTAGYHRHYAAYLSSTSSTFTSHLLQPSSSSSSLQCATQSKSFATLKNRRRRRTNADSDSSSTTNNTPSPSSLFDNSSSTSSLSSSTNLTPGSLPGLTEPYTPLNPHTSQPMTMSEYNSYATLSPWVPTPDIVARRMLEIASASSQDYHVELGSGDGRVNFTAIDKPFEVMSSIGIELDPGLIRLSMERRMKRHPVPENLLFLECDLLSLLPKSNTNNKKESNEKEEQKQKVQNIISQSTILTMYFVEEALQQIKPLLESYLQQNTKCRVVTCGYEMKGWNPSWVEVVLGLPIYLYKMNDDSEVGGGGPVMTSFGTREEEKKEKKKEIVLEEELKPVRRSGAEWPKAEEQPLIPEGDDVDIEEDEDWDEGFEEEDEEDEKKENSGGGVDGESGGANGISSDDDSSSSPFGGGGRGWKSDKR